MKRCLQRLNSSLRAAVSAIVRVVILLVSLIVSLWRRLDPDIHDLHIYGGATGVYFGIKYGLAELIVVFGFFAAWGVYGAIWSAKRGE